MTTSRSWEKLRVHSSRNEFDEAALLKMPARRGRRQQNAEPESEEEDAKPQAKAESEEDMDYDEDEDDDDDEEDEIQRKELPQRSTRGRRTAKFVEDDADEDFWNQEAWKELDEKDEDIKSDDFTSDDFADSADSDIDLDEEAEIQQEQAEAMEFAKQSTSKGRRGRDMDEDDDRLSKKKKSKYVDPALARVKKHRDAKPKTSPLKVPIQKREITLRESTKRISENRKAEAQLESKKVKIKKKPESAEGEDKIIPKLTHREMLEAAARTEFENKKRLLEMIVLQEAKKKQREAEEVEEVKGPRVFYKSTAKGDSISYTEATLFPLTKTAPPPPHIVKCAVTGLPAKYRLPKSLVPFANVPAYKKLRGLA